MKFNSQKMINNSVLIFLTITVFNKNITIKKIKRENNKILNNNIIIILQKKKINTKINTIIYKKIVIIKKMKIKGKK